MLPKKRELRAGLISTGILMIVLLFVFLTPGNFFKRYNTYTVLLGNAEGLHPGSPVVIGDLQKGYIKKISLLNKGSNGVDIKVKVERKVHLPKNSSAGLMLWPEESQRAALAVSLQGSEGYLNSGDTIFTEYYARHRLTHLTEAFQNLQMDSLIHLNPLPANGEAPDAVYKVQILVSGKKLPPGHKAFLGLKEVEWYIQDGLYKYTRGEYKFKYEALKARDSLQEMGFKDAFVVKMSKDERIKM
ncbi:MAG: MCE family protein [Bacteroidales bacterium]|nr:MCE family protein [Bacteroidales bacterium]